MAYNNYEILSKDTVVAIWKNNKLKVINNDLLPLYLKRIHNPDMWLETRAVDSHRANSRLLKKAIRLEYKDDLSTVLHVNGATITDTYWVRPIGSKLTYSDVKFQKDSFSTLALKGLYRSFNYVSKLKDTRTPELTNTGSFEKGWKLIDKKWWLYKKANHNEQFSELFAYELGSALGMNMAYYEKGDGCVRTLDFTDNASVNFEPAMSFMGDNEDYTDTIEALKRICPAAIADYVKMIFLDAVIANPDRHTNNFGLLRDTNTGTIIGLAPIFDHNMSVIARGYPGNPKATDLLISLFNDLMKKYPEYTTHIPSVTEQTVINILDKINMRVKRQVIIDLVMGRYGFIERTKKK
ncbi:MAG: hypothetical protein BWX78_01499 [Firmicutes bacterium ADurb.Bin099]|nr:MAG: hypothetical protein BWX78_01499 [Firmicutes bacterium ADurb.Bin099]